MIYYNVGRREVGKTTLARYLVQKQETRIVFDPRGHFPAASRALAYENVIAAFDALYERGHGEIIVTPERDVQELFETTAREVKRWIQNAKSCAFVVDECSLVDLRARPKESADEFDWIIRLCPRRQAIVVLTGHRPVDVPVSVRAIADFWILFQMTQEHDLEVVENRCGRAVRDALTKLKPFEFVVWDDAKGTFTVNKNKEAWHLPLTDHSAVSAMAFPSIDGDPPAATNSDPNLFDV